MYYMIGYDKCSTCLKALKHLKEKNMQVTFFDVKKNPPTKAQLLEVASRVDNKDLLWNTSGKMYRELDIKSKKHDLTIDQMVTLFLEEGMLLKRPILYNDEKIIVGYKKEIYENL